MNPNQHYRGLEQMHLAAPINELYQPAIRVSEGEAEIIIPINPRFYHTSEAIHGSVYFKMPDDSAFFAAASLEPKVFLLTASFTTYLTRPVSSATMRAVGKVVNLNRSQFIAESVVYNENDRAIGSRNGIFARSNKYLSDTIGYGA